MRLFAWNALDTGLHANSNCQNSEWEPALGMVVADAILVHLRCLHMVTTHRALACCCGRKIVTKVLQLFGVSSHITQ